jgi:hypothetical protein
VTEAVRLAGAYTHTGIETASPIGSGFGPLNHIHSITPRLIAPYVTDVGKLDNELTAVDADEPRRTHIHSRVLL